MTFLSLLLFASAFYFAYGRPDAYSDSQAVAKTPDAEVNPFQKQMDGFIQALDKAMTDYMMPIMSEMSNDTQEELKTMAINGCYSYINYVMLMAQEKNGSSDIKTDSQGIPIDKGDITLEFLELSQLDDDALYIPADSSNPPTTAQTRAESEAGDSDTVAHAAVAF